MQQRWPWPDRLWIVRHGESAGNVARDAAHAEGLDYIDIQSRDVNVPLSELGQQQAEALGRWFADMPLRARPDIILSSPYLRAQSTAKAVCNTSGIAESCKAVVVDERLREKKFGALDRPTKTGIEQHFPQEAAARQWLGKFYYRPPSGESWADVIVRLHSVLDT